MQLTLIVVIYTWNMVLKELYLIAGRVGVKISQYIIIPQYFFTIYCNMKFSIPPSPNHI